MAFSIEKDGEKAYATLVVPNYDIKAVTGMLVERASRTEVVIIEAFIGTRPLSSDAINTLEMIGAVRGVCAVLNIPVVKHTPSTRTPFEKEARTRLQARKAAHGLGYMDHEVSALAHLLAYELRLHRATVKQTPAFKTLKSTRARRVILTGRHI